jgi:hypothetical protein
VIVVPSAGESIRDRRSDRAQSQTEEDAEEADLCVLSVFCRIRKKHDASRPGSAARFLTSTAELGMVLGIAHQVIRAACSSALRR